MFWSLLAKVFNMRRKRKRIVLLFCGLVLVFILSSIKKNFPSSIYETISSLVCDEKHGKAVLQNLCQSYKEGKVAGNLCADLCETGQLIIEQCLSHKNDNVIFSAKWRHLNIILKTKKMPLYNSWENIFPDSGNQELSALQHNFLTAVYDLIMSQLVRFKDIESNTKNKLIDPKILLATLYFDASVSSLSLTDMHSLWELLQQDEFYVIQLLKDFKHMPKITGTCGKFYALEELESLANFVGPGFMSASVTWKVRVKLGLDIIDLVQEFDSNTAYGFSWQHCDVQPSNFGVNEAGTVKAIDVDLFYTNEKIAEILGQQLGNCSSHKDCEFFDCASLCNVESKKCMSVKTSNNLQVVCRDLLQSKWYGSGLLAGIPSQSEKKFNKILDECSAATLKPWTKRKYNRILNTLKSYLLEENRKV